MVGTRRVLGFSRGRALGFICLGAIVAAAGCSVASNGTGVPIGGSAGSGFSAGGSLEGNADIPCAQPAGAPVFAAQTFNSSRALLSRELYTWTTSAAAAALRQDQALFSEPAGSGAPFTLLDALSSNQIADLELVQALKSQLQMARYAWPEPWTIRMGMPGSDPGGELVRIVLKPDAWLAVSNTTGLFVFDSNGQRVENSDAVAQPERIGALYFDTVPADETLCLTPSASSAANSRGFMLGNIAAVQEWSLGTQDMLDRLKSNIQDLSAFLDATRSCPAASDFASWSVAVSCSWADDALITGLLVASANGTNAVGSGGAAGASEGGNSGFGDAGAPGSGAAPSLNGGGAAGFGGDLVVDPPVNSPTPFQSIPNEYAYDQSLALVNQSYLSQPAQIAAIIEALQGDLFDPDPLIVTPGSP